MVKVSDYSPHGVVRSGSQGVVGGGAWGSYEWWSGGQGVRGGGGGGMG